MNNPYPPAATYTGPGTYQGASAGGPHAPQVPQPAYRPAPTLNTDATNGLVHQFSHQNLGGGGRASPYGSRQPAPASQRPRTAGTPGQSGSGGYLNAPMPSQASQQQSWYFQAAPERNPDKYGIVAHNNQKKAERLASDFFKDSVKRARDRNVR